jgi:hypothetical protein
MHISKNMVMCLFVVGLSISGEVRGLSISAIFLSAEIEHGYQHLSAEIDHCKNHKINMESNFLLKQFLWVHRRYLCSP